MGVHHCPRFIYVPQNVSATSHQHAFLAGIGIHVILTNLMKGALNFPFTGFSEDRYNCMPTVGVMILQVQKHGRTELVKQVSMIVGTLPNTPVWSWENLEIYGSLSCYVNNQLRLPISCRI